MRTQLKDLSELVGRTIEGAHQAQSWSGDAVVLVLSGDAFAFLSPDKDRDGDMEVEVGRAFPLLNYLDRAVEWGICTQEENDEASGKEKQTLAELIERRERATYEQLRAKFEGKGQ